MTSYFNVNMIIINYPIMQTGVLQDQNQKLGTEYIFDEYSSFKL